ncbi:AbiV family abortive infection protein [Parvimonas parva]|uniref:AbiV family abortive infection protein n=1 Tax=Parvimonas parva TaxID=2769485 RepID=A0ABS1C754_9FIRM|nr:AbiV family abortive infection protein [Parvimonas parva]MBK1467734.1 AbiV family abortive infection protein [Parvimonas parva]
MPDKKTSIEKVKAIVEGNSNFFIDTTEELNKCIKHISNLISDSYILYKNNSFTSSAFLSIAIIEEVGKVHMGIYIKPSDSFIKKDKLRDHKSKQIVGANYTISMSDRINKGISIEKFEKIFELAYSGKLKELREKAIYCDRENNDIIIPQDTISQEFSRNMLLFAIESFNDNLVGYTSYSMEESKKTDILFENIAKL